MRIVIFCHSLVSDWNHGNAHFLRGVCAELLARGHALNVYEPANAWSVRNLLAEYGEAPFGAFSRAYPMLHSHRYELDTLDLDEALAADLVIVHEWNDSALIKRIGEHRRANAHYRLLFHDTHHRCVTDSESMAAYKLEHYDGVLAFGNVLRDLYRARGWAQRAWTWHEAADTRVFHPRTGEAWQGDLVWVGNWGDEERSAELQEFLLDPVRAMRLRARIHGVRYPDAARRRLAEAGIEYAGWLPNYQAPRVFAQFGVTVHVPRRPYVAALPGIPTIRVFEALACGVPLVCAPWNDSEGLFTPGKDFLVARNGSQMQGHLYNVLHDRELAAELSERGRRTVLAKHTCAHRVDELLGIYSELSESKKAMELIA
ncbi:MAG TPA: glycosyltransferase [Burkholderiales bacterium]|nr:glycosyltransferase [Burkholderiales bacterium]